ncbi:ficolin-2 [Plakobranchus ocellatus]|uniref:Ficolin-2 n=1 Tax=Plakobranchus ocellatus TaxID=259542 RepID=A0AAV3YVZ3_9GAST|nr:ficolin-2 [Plakobranchus ocellatus]
MARVMTKALLLAMMMVMNVFAETKDVAESLLDLERKLIEISASLNKTNETHAQLRRHQELPTTCERGMGDDITKNYPHYVIMSHDGPKKQILCDTHTDGGGWIVFQRRATGDVDFYRDWTSYREGFGSLTGDFWMGNEALYNLTDKDPYELRIDIRINNGQEIFARYPDFRIESESNKEGLLENGIGVGNDLTVSQRNNFRHLLEKRKREYNKNGRLHMDEAAPACQDSSRDGAAETRDRTNQAGDRVGGIHSIKQYRLQIGSYTGTVEDRMAYHNKMFFSTFDRDNDERAESCAVTHHGAWWYKDCYHTDLNSEWAVTETKDDAWYDGKKWWHTSFTEMKMRRIKLI